MRWTIAPYEWPNPATFSSSRPSTVFTISIFRGCVNIRDRQLDSQLIEPIRNVVAFDTVRPLVLRTSRAPSFEYGTEPVSRRDIVTQTVLVQCFGKAYFGKKYKLAKPKMIDVINSLFEEPNICFEDGQVVWRALSDYTQAKAVTVAGKKKEVNFADALVVNKARHCAGKQGKALEGFYTFDVAEQAMPGTASPCGRKKPLRSVQSSVKKRV